MAALNRRLLNPLLLRWQGIVLAATFAVSHNVREAKALAPGTLVAHMLSSDMARRDWGLQQVCPVGPVCAHGLLMWARALVLAPRLGPAAGVPRRTCMRTWSADVGACSGTGAATGACSGCAPADLAIWQHPCQCVHPRSRHSTHTKLHTSRALHCWLAVSTIKKCFPFCGLSHGFGN